MTFASIPGMVVSFGLILLALALGGEVDTFINPQAALIVVGGSLGALLTNYSPGAVLQSMGLIRKSMRVALPSPEQTSEQFVEYAYLARREGILVLEPIARELEDHYLRKGLQLTVDGLEPEAIEAIMHTEIDNMEEKHATGAEMLGSLASYAPAMGLIGTVIGLVQMLRTISDPSSIGPGMATALITTFYGVILANLVFLPLCGKIRHRARQETRMREMQLAGILGIARGENPRIVREVLDGFNPRHGDGTGEAHAQP